MDPIPFLLLVLILVIGGVIAFLADRLGRKLGKKRLSLFKLRPRHTAELLTVGAGVLIPLVTIGILTTASQGIRSWLVLGPAGVERMRQNVANLYTEQDRLLRSTTNLKAEVVTTSGRLAALQKSYSNKEKQLRKDLEQMRQDVATVSQAKEAALRTASGLDRDLRSKRLELTGIQTRYADIQTRYADVQKKYAAAFKQWTSLQGTYKALDKQYRETLAFNTDLQKERDSLERQVGPLKQEKKELDERLAQARKALEDFQTDLDNATHALEAKQQELDGLSAQAEQLKAAFDQSLFNTRFTRLVYPVGSELARVTLKPQESPVQARAALMDLLAQSRAAAEGAGAKPAKAGEPSAALRDIPESNGRKITAQEQADAIVKAVSSLPEESVIVAYSFWNVYEGESVPLHVRAWRNPLVYRAGDLIAEMRIDGRLSDDQIVSQINTLLTTGVRERAKRDRMIPIGSDESYGQVSSQQLLSLVSDLKNENRRVRLQAVAKNDTRAADPLQLTFRIRY
jgi:uncharacterized protein (DUF3084 family)